MVKPDPIYDAHWIITGYYITCMIYDALVEHAQELGISIDAWSLVDHDGLHQPMVIGEDYNAPY